MTSQEIVHNKNRPGLETRYFCFDLAPCAHMFPGPSAVHPPWTFIRQLRPHRLPLPSASDVLPRFDTLPVGWLTPRSRLPLYRRGNHPVVVTLPVDWLTSRSRLPLCRRANHPVVVTLPVPVGRLTPRSRLPLCRRANHPVVVTLPVGWPTRACPPVRHRPALSQ